MQFSYKTNVYSNLCSIFYDTTKKYASQEEVDFYASFIEKNKGRVLEAMSGSGRLQIPLIQKGYIVDGVDSSETMLNRCKKRCTDLHINCDLYQQNLEDLNISQKYSVITIAVGSFQLLSEKTIALEALKKLHFHMESNGDLLIDIFVPDLTADPRSIRIAKIDEKTNIRLTTRYIFDEKNKVADAYCLYELISQGEVVEEETELIKVIWYTEDDFKKLLYQAGFKIESIHEKVFRPGIDSKIVHAKKI